MQTIIPSGPAYNNPKQHVFLVKWKGFTQDDNTWETYENVAEHDKEFLKDYHARNPTVEKDGRFVKNVRRKKT
jgi:hypothetical protein